MARSEQLPQPMPWGVLLVMVVLGVQAFTAVVGAWRLWDVGEYGLGFAGVLEGGVKAVIAWALFAARGWARAGAVIVLAVSMPVGLLLGEEEPLLVSRAVTLVVCFALLWVGDARKFFS
jgi:hypothetical protein